MSPEQMDEAMKASLVAFPQATEGLGAQVLAPTILADGTKQFELTAAVTKWEVDANKTVDAYTYNGTVPGPTIKVDPGDHVKIVLHNQLTESTSIHFHGLLTPNSMDGTTYVTQDPVKPGETYTYEWTVQDTPAVGMYHSHHIAFQQVPDGLAGAFIVGDEPVPAGVTVSQQQIMMLNDSGVIGYALNGKSFPATAPIVAKQGEWVEVQYMNEGVQIHPMHLHGMPQMVIAKDGMPLANPQEEDTVTVAPGERYTVLIHATEPGTWVWHCHILPHAENENGMFGMVTALVVQ
jgi:FtsP/CotA-like multicopper oxidase with cupredoxin domain